MEVIVNGEKRVFEKEMTIQKTIEDLGVAGKVMAAAVNMEIIKKDQWSDHQLQDGDQVELLHFVGGG